MGFIVHTPAINAHNLFMPRCQGPPSHHPHGGPPGHSFPVSCNHCKQTIQGVRYQCLQCQFHLCEQCEAISPPVHNENHIFAKINKPQLALPQPTFSTPGRPHPGARGLSHLFTESPPCDYKWKNKKCKGGKKMQRILRLEDQVTELEEQISQLYEERALRKPIEKIVLVIINN